MHSAAKKCQCGRGNPDAAGRCNPRPCLRWRAHPRRRHHGAGPAKGKTRTGRLWTYVRDDRAFVGPDPPAAAFFYSLDHGGEHPEQHLAGYAGLLQADACAGFGRLYEASRKGGPVIETACWARASRKFFDLARLTKAPVAAEGQANRCPVRHRARDQRSCAARAINYCLSRWDAFTRFLDDERLCMSNRAVAVGRRNWILAGSDEGDRRAAAIYTLIASAKLNDIDP
jgi:transposase